MAVEPVLQGGKRRDKIIHAAVINIDPITAARCMLAILPQDVYKLHCEVFQDTGHEILEIGLVEAALGAI